MMHLRQEQGHIPIDRVPLVKRQLSVPKVATRSHVGAGVCFVTVAGKRSTGMNTSMKKRKGRRYVSYSMANDRKWCYVFQLGHGMKMLWTMSIETSFNSDI